MLNVSEWLLGIVLHLYSTEKEGNQLVTVAVIDSCVLVVTVGQWLLCQPVMVRLD